MGFQTPSGELEWVLIQERINGRREHVSNKNGEYSNKGLHIATQCRETLNTTKARKKPCYLNLHRSRGGGQEQWAVYT